MRYVFNLRISTNQIVTVPWKFTFFLK